MERPDIGNTTEEIRHYIDSLEKRVEGASMLSKEISLLKAGIAHDLQLIRLGEQGEEYEHLKYICLDKLSPKFNLVKILMTNINTVESETAGKAGRPAKKEDPEEKLTIPIAGELEPEAPVRQMRNPMEEFSEKLRQKHAAR